MRLTARRVDALRYARGDHDHCPTYGVARPLEVAGLIAWTAYRPGAGALERYYAARDGKRGWTITAAGRAMLETPVANRDEV